MNSKLKIKNSKLRLSHKQRLFADYVMAEQLRETFMVCQNWPSAGNYDNNIYLF